MTKMRHRARPDLRYTHTFSTLGIVSMLVVLSACAAPIGVHRVSPRKAQAGLTQSILTNGELSERSRILLRRVNREEEWKKDPARVLAILHQSLSRPATAFNAELRASLLDSVAELAFAHASKSGDRRYYLAAALYAWLYLFPSNEELIPSPLDRGVRLAADLYNRSLTLAFTDLGTGEITAPSDFVHELPFGDLTIDFKEESLVWGNRELSHFVSLTELEVRGLNNRYRRSGLGMPLAARASEPNDLDDNDPIYANVRVPVSILLQFENPESSLQSEHFRASAYLVAYSFADSTMIQGHEFPAEFEPTAALALQLTEDPPWKRELKGFFQGDLALDQLGITSLTPYQRGRIPVVLVHGTASSAGRWADLLNDLSDDDILRQHFQFWFFTYNTGNPIAYSGWLLRKAIAELVQSLDPEDREMALRDLVVMGHSQGGLLTKLLVIDSGDQFWNLVIDEPPDRVRLKRKNRELLEGSLVLVPSPYIKRVIFLSTPHRGSRLATMAPAVLLGRAVRSPANLVAAVGDLFADDPEEEVQRRIEKGAGSVANMSPSSTFIKALARMPIAPGIHAHSIIGVKKGPKEEGSDGVVAYQSAHLDDVESELVVESGHSSQSNPVVIGEVRRILIEHLAEAIEQGIVPPLDGTGHD